MAANGPLRCVQGKPFDYAHFAGAQRRQGRPFRQAQAGSTSRRVAFRQGPFPLGTNNLAAFLLQVPSLKKQELLEVDQASQLLTETRDHYRREIALLENLITSNPKGDAKGARLN
jgi:hypothetical protein